MDENKQEYINLLRSIPLDIKRIDDKVSWQEVEPEWWLNMMNLQRFVLNSLRIMDDAREGYK
jgi:hypothetical protein